MEALMIAAYPAHGIAYVAVSDNSINTAMSIYTDNSCWWSGNGDAFRHIYWNVELYNSFSNVALSALDLWFVSVETKVSLFTAAHEYYATQDIHKDMDVQNNYTGLYICAPIWYNSSTSQSTAVTTERFIDLGGAVRVSNLGWGDILVSTNNSKKR